MEAVLDWQARRRPNDCDAANTVSLAAGAERASPLQNRRSAHPAPFRRQTPYDATSAGASPEHSSLIQGTVVCPPADLLRDQATLQLTIQATRQLIMQTVTFTPTRLSIASALPGVGECETPQKLPDTDRDTVRGAGLIFWLPDP